MVKYIRERPPTPSSAATHSLTKTTPPIPHPSHTHTHPTQAPPPGGAPLLGANGGAPHQEDGGRPALLPRPPHRPPRPEARELFVRGAYINKYTCIYLYLKGGGLETFLFEVRSLVCFPYLVGVCVYMHTYTLHIYTLTTNIKKKHTVGGPRGGAEADRLRPLPALPGQPAHAPPRRHALLRRPVRKLFIHIYI